jgi:hypothetical protein
MLQAARLSLPLSLLLQVLLLLSALILLLLLLLLLPPLLLLRLAVGRVQQAAHQPVRDLGRCLGNRVHWPAGVPCKTQADITRRRTQAAPRVKLSCYQLCTLLGIMKPRHHARCSHRRLLKLLLLPGHGL